LIADGGCTDDTIEIVCEFPRVEIFDHKKFLSLGYSIRKLIEQVKTEWFIYLHSDIYVPENWFDAMAGGCAKYDWFESGQTTTILAKFVAPTLGESRAYSGAQMGRKGAFDQVLPRIDDDFLYRNEDIIFASLIENSGHRYGKITDAFCEHQVMFKESPWERRVKHVYVVPEIGRDEEIRAAMTYVKGIVKYLRPEQSITLVPGLKENLVRLNDLGAIEATEFAHWVAEINPAWSDIFPVPKVLHEASAAVQETVPVSEPLRPVPEPLRVESVGPKLRAHAIRIEGYVRARAMRLQGYLYAAKGIFRRLVSVYRADGVRGTRNLIMRRIRKHRE
jgi:hypothetical protein